MKGDKIMAYIALYRAYRPQKFSDVVGQEHIIKTLQHAIEMNKVAHAYLFCGPRGTGKTTLAKIMAKAMNCVNGPIKEPCCECEICRGIAKGTISDVIEIDAASNNGADDIRALRDTVKFLPAQGKYKVYILHSSCDMPVYSFEFEKLKSNSIEWFKPKEDILLPYESQEIDAGGSWYIGYLQSDLPENSQAINRDRDWSTQPCKGCSRQEFLAWQAWSKYIEVHPFYVDENQLLGEDEQMYFDPEIMNFTYDANYGINLDVSVYCDLTDFIIKQKQLFQDVIAKQVAVDFLREFAYNPNVRTNRRSINASRTDILYELDGDSSSMKHSGLNYELDLALKALNFSTQGLDRVCLPCVNHGLKYRTV